MTALLWDDIEGDLVSAKKHFAQAVALYGTGVGDYVPSMAFQHAMQSGYTSFEAAMKRLLHLVDEGFRPGRIGMPSFSSASVVRSRAIDLRSSMTLCSVASRTCGGFATWRCTPVTSSSLVGPRSPSRRPRRSWPASTRR